MVMSTESSSLTSRKRTIRFAETLCQYGKDAEQQMEPLTEEELLLIWYSPTDLNHIKKKAHQTAKETPKSVCALLTNTYGRNEGSESLKEWTRICSSRRGLERWVNDEFAAKRADIRQRTIKSVLRAQKKIQEDPKDDPDYSTSVLARLSETFSQDARQMASVLGQADELVAQDSSPDAFPAPFKDHRSVRRSSPTSVLALEEEVVSNRKGATHQQKQRQLRLAQQRDACNDMRHFY